MADGSITFDTSIDTRQLETELRRVRQKILKMQEDLYTAQNDRLPLVDKMHQLGLELTAAKAQLQDMRAAGMAMNDPAVYDAQVEKVRQLNQAFIEARNAVQSADSNISNLNSNIERQRSLTNQLSGEIERRRQSEEEAGQAAEETAESTAHIGENATYSASMIETLTKRIVGLAKRVFIFSVITKALRSIRTYLAEAGTKSTEFSAALSQLKAALMTAVQPIISALIPALTWLMQVLTSITSAVAGFISMLFGKSISASAASAKALNKQADAYSAAGSAAEDAKRQLMGFDEINKLSDTSSGGGGGGSSSDSSPDFSIFDGFEFDSEKFKPLTDAIQNLKNALTPLFNTLVTTGRWVLDNVLIPIGEWAATSLLPAVINILSSGFVILNIALQTIIPVLQQIWEIISPFVAWAGNTLVNILTKVSDWVTEHQETIGGLVGIIAKIALGVALLQNKTKLLHAGILLITKAFGLIVSTITSPITWLLVLGTVLVELWDKCEGFREGMIQAWSGVLEFFEGVVDFIKSMFTGDMWDMEEASAKMVEGGKNIIEGLKTGISAAWETLKEWISDIWESFVQGFKDFFGIHSPSTVMSELGGYLISGLLEGIETAWTSITEWLGGIADEVVTAFSTTWASVTEWWTTNIAPIFTADYWAGIWGTVTDGLSQLSIVSAIQNIWNSLTTWWAENVSPIFTLEYWANVFSAIGEGLKSALLAPINWAIAQLNSLISNINGALAIDVPDWVPGFGGSHWGVTIPDIPYLAQGAVIPANNEFLAVLGDQKKGTNVEAPLDTIKQAVAEVLESGQLVSLMEQLVNLNQQIANKSTTLELDGRELATTVTSYQNDMSRAWG